MISSNRLLEDPSPFIHTLVGSVITSLCMLPQVLSFLPFLHPLRVCLLQPAVNSSRTSANTQVVLTTTSCPGVLAKFTSLSKPLLFLAKSSGTCAGFLRQVGAKNFNSGFFHAKCFCNTTQSWARCRWICNCRNNALAYYSGKACRPADFHNRSACVGGKMPRSCGIAGTGGDGRQVGWKARFHSLCPQLNDGN